MSEPKPEYYMDDESMTAICSQCGNEFDRSEMNWSWGFEGSRLEGICRHCDQGWTTCDCDATYSQNATRPTWPLRQPQGRLYLLVGLALALMVAAVWAARRRGH